jgi:pimeloyl-ACP methyl ester carboxylesterase
MFDEGSGPALVVVPGVQGRWEWLRPGLVELSRCCRTISYSLAGDFGSNMPYDPALGFENYVRQLDDVLERCEVRTAALCGISYGGFIVVRYAALRPERVTAVVLASAPSPGWTPNPRQQRYLARPWVSAPSFIFSSPLRLFPEIRAAYDTWPQRIGFAAAHATRAAMHPMIPAHMAERIAVQQAMDLAPDCAAVRAPTLVIGGEEPLDRIVPVSATRRYAQLIPGARYVTLERTGHLGVVTRPRRFAELVGGFVNDATHP